MDIVVWFISLLVVVVALAAVTGRYFSYPLRGSIAIILVAAVASWVVFRYPIDQFLLYSMLFGAFVGAAEVISRYRDEPFLALLGNVYGASYMAINGLLSAVAYGLLFHYRDRVLVGMKDDSLLMAVVAGFGSSVVMRSKFFTFRTPAGEDTSVGPDAVIQIFLRCVDRGIDRHRSMRRQRLVYRRSKAILPGNVDRAIPLMRAAIPSFQNLSNQEKQDFDALIEGLAKQVIDRRLKLMAVCFAFLNLSGEDNFSGLMDNVEDYLNLPVDGTTAGPPPPPPQPPAPGH